MDRQKQVSDFSQVFTKCHRHKWITLSNNCGNKSDNGMSVYSTTNVKYNQQCLLTFLVAMGNTFSWSKSKIQKYRRLGSGAFGSVYFVNFWLYKRNYAVKVVDLPNHQVRNQALKEAETLTKVNNHENVIKIYSAEISPDGALLIWMEHGDLGDLRHYMRASRLSIDDIIALMKQLCDAVNYIHSKAVIHRDIKPANILLKRSGETIPTLKLGDFGIGSFAESISFFEQIYFGTFCGTPSYMAPEVLQRGRYHNSADIYSMGVVIKIIIERYGKSTF